MACYFLTESWNCNQDVSKFKDLNKIIKILLMHIIIVFETEKNLDTLILLNMIKE